MWRKKMSEWAWFHHNLGIYTRCLTLITSSRNNPVLLRLLNYTIPLPLPPIPACSTFESSVIKLVCTQYTYLYHHVKLKKIEFKGTVKESRDQYTALPLVGVLVTDADVSIILSNISFINEKLLNSNNNWNKPMLLRLL